MQQRSTRISWFEHHQFGGLPDAAAIHFSLFDTLVPKENYGQLCIHTTDNNIL